MIKQFIIARSTQKAIISFSAIKFLRWTFLMGLLANDELHNKTFEIISSEKSSTLDYA